MKKKLIELLLNLTILGLIILLSGCRPGVQEDATKLVPLKKIKSRDYPVFSDTLKLKGLSDAVENSLTYYKRVPLDRKFRFENDEITAAHMILSLETFQHFLSTGPTAKQMESFIRKQYDVYAAVGNKDRQVLYTGYFEPTYKGSIKRSDAYSYPLYSKPEDLLEIDLSLFSNKYKGHRRLVARVVEGQRRVVPYFSRGQINRIHDFYERAEPIAWLNNRVDRFFLEIQGSGRIALAEGGIMRVHYAGSNGNAYRSIGKYLIDQNEIPRENMSMQAIREWLDFHPERLDEVLHYNESVVFFKQEEGGPFGSLGVKVNPFRSIATDSRLFPKGALCFVTAELPDRTNVNPVKKWHPASFFVLNQDTGGAIKGPARADIFCGNDNYAAFTAGHMKVYGKLYFLVLK